MTLKVLLVSNNCFKFAKKIILNHVHFYQLILLYHNFEDILTIRSKDLIYSNLIITITLEEPLPEDINIEMSLSLYTIENIL